MYFVPTFINLLIVSDLILRKLPVMQVTDQDLDVWQNTPACVPDALRHYYYEYLSSTAEAAEVVLEPFLELVSCNDVDFLRGEN